MNMPFFMPIMQPQAPPSEILPYALPPLRIRVALDFLNQLSAKMAVRAACSESQVIELDGQKLTTAEANAQASACNLLVDYFLGSLKPDRWEKEAFDRIQKEANPLNMGTIINCFSCSPNPPKPSCKFCHGGGSVLVVPTS